MQIQIKIPFDINLSKNRSNRIGRGKYGGKRRIYKNPITAKLKSDIVLLIRSKSIGYKWEKKKLYFQVFVYKPPGSNCDAQNFIDEISDAIEDATGINDYWYAGSWDWAKAETDKDAYIDIFIKQN